MDTAASTTTATDPASSRHAMLLVAFTAAIFVSAALLFAVQPMFAKMVLPKLGGAPSVWSVAMVFFQTALLAGYAYAHLLTRFAPGRLSVPIHLAVMIVACLALPLAIAASWGRPPAQGEAFWLLGLFTVSIGLPFFALSANSSLLQAWFARTDHPAARDPYFLYAASNIGSFLALITYPAAVEPLLRLSDQTWLWSLGFYLLIAMIAVCGVLLWRTPERTATDQPASTADAAEAAPPTWRDVASWIAPRRSAVRAPGGGDRAYFDRRGRRAAALGAAACALSRDLRHRIPIETADPALAGGRGPAGLHHWLHCVSGV